MQNVLFITNSVGFGGAAKMLCFMAESLAERGKKVLIVNLKTTGNISSFERTAGKAEIITLAPPDKQNKNIYYIREIKKIAKQFKAEAIVGFTAFPNMYAAIVAKLLHIPSVIAERGDPARTSGNSVKDKVQLFLINRSAGGVFQTEGAKEYYGKGLQKRGAVIPNPIFINGEAPNIPYEIREKTVVSVGRFDNNQKRLDIMLKAFKLFLKSHPDYILKLYGKGDDEEQIRQWCKELEIVDKIKFMGLTTSPMTDIAKDSMFIITSDYEGISNALLEAMAVGLPCVSTDHTPGGARLLIKHGENGLLAPIGDTEALAKCMCLFAENESLAKKCGENAKDVAVRFNPDRIIDMWEDYINKICDK